MEKTRVEVVVAPASEAEGYRVHAAMRDSCPRSGVMSKKEATQHAQYLVRVLQTAGISASCVVQDEPYFFEPFGPLEFTD